MPRVLIGEESELANLAIDINGLSLKNPVMTASGTFGYGLEFSPYLDLNKLGGVIVKGVSLQPKAGNPPPRVVETACGMLNAIGLENVGVHAFISDKLPKLKSFDTKVIVNILGDSIEEYVEIARILDEAEGIHGIEVNISCPNVKKGGVAFGTNAQMAHEVCSKVRGVTTLPVIMKLSPNVTDISGIAMAVEDGGADAVSLINTILGMAIDIEQRRPKLANIVGGLSGPAIKPVALRMVWQVASRVKIPVIGIGGIMSASDAIEFILAGASAVEVGTANFRDPAVTSKIIDGIHQYCTRHGIENLSELVGTLHTQ